MKKLDNKTSTMMYIELKHNKELEDILYDLYIEKEKSIREISETLGVHYHTVNSWLNKVGIKTRLPHQKLMELVDIKRKLKDNEEQK